MFSARAESALNPGATAEETLWSQFSPAFTWVPGVKLMQQTLLKVKMRNQNKLNPVSHRVSGRDQHGLKTHSLHTLTRLLKGLNFWVSLIFFFG